MDNTCNLSSEQMHKAEMTYTALHEGQRPRELLCETVCEPEGSMSPLLDGARETRIAEIQYWKKVTDGAFRYHHPFASHARPIVCVDSTGKIFIKRGRYVTTYRGIEDRKVGQVETERFPGRATILTTLGPLDWMVVVDEKGRKQRIEFGGNVRSNPEASTTIAHDQNGDLHVVYPSKNRSNPTKRGGERLFEQERSRGSKTMRHIMGARRRARHNPRRVSRARVAAVTVSGQPQTLTQALSGERLKAMFKSSLMLGGGAIVGTIAMDKLMTMESIATRLPASPYAKAAIRVVLGVVGGLALGYAVPALAPLAAGLAIGGVVDGGRLAIAAYQAPRAPAIQPDTTPVPQRFATIAERDNFITAHPTLREAAMRVNVGPAAMAYMAAAGVNLPAGYTSYNQQACAR